MDNVTFFTSATQDQAVEFAKTAVSNRLFVTGWRLNQVLHQIINRDTNESINPVITICVDNLTGAAVGIAVRCKCSVFALRYTMQVFTRQSYRRRGIGTRMVDLCGGMTDCFGGPGIEGSDQFWENCRQRQPFEDTDDELELQIA